MLLHQEPIHLIATICTTGRGKLLVRAVESVLAQKQSPTKLIICFDKKATLQEYRSEILHLNQEKGCDVEMIQNTHREGLAGNANTILEHLLNNHAINPSNTFVAFLDDDDYWPEDYLLKCAPALQEGKDVTASSIQRIEKNDTFIDQLPPESLDIEQFFIGGAAIQLSNLIVRLSVLDAIGMFDEELLTNHDRDISIRLAEGGYSYKAIHDTAIHHDTTHDYWRMSSASNPLKQKGIRRFYDKWVPAMREDVLQHSLERSARFFKYQEGFAHAELLIGTMCISQKGLESFIHQFEQIKLPHFNCRIIAFANFEEGKNSKFETAFGSVDVFTLPKLKAPAPISKARNVLHYRILKSCQDEDYDPLIWLLDEDAWITPESIAKLPHCWALKFSKRYDVLIGTMSGESPNSALFGLRGELSDFKQNLNWLDELKTNEPLPNRAHNNQDYVTSNPEYYYDLDTRTHSELNSGSSVLWLAPVDDKETVKEARNRLATGLKHVSEGRRFFRLIREKKTAPIWKDAKPSLHRGPNCFILNIDALRVPNPQIKVNNQYLRRSDMMWALTISHHFNFKTVEVDVPIVHTERQEEMGELEVEKNNTELIGSILFNALKQCKDVKDGNEFFPVLKGVAEMRLERIERNIQGIQNLLLELAEIPDEKIGLCIKYLQGTMKSFGPDWLLTLKEMFSKPQFAASVLEQYHNFVMHRSLIGDISNVLPTDVGKFTLWAAGDGFIKMLIQNDPWQDANPLIRVHSSCTHSEIFGAKDCDCDSQLQSAKALIAHHGSGIIFYLEQEGRGHGFLTKLKIVDAMEKNGITTYEACDLLGIEQDERNYQQVVQLMHDTGLEDYTLLSNNPTKAQAFIDEFGAKRRPLIGDFNDENCGYLVSKNKNKHRETFVTRHTLDSIKFDNRTQPIKFYQKDDVYGFLSNFDRRAIHRDGAIWPTSEHAYQAQKFLDPELRKAIRQESDPNLVKVLASKHQQAVRDDWDEIKIPVMCAILKDKIFQYSELKEKLLGTGRAEIIEFTETDMFWGRSASGVGHNYLGKAWMFIRQYYEGS